jgi:hypothetical protein
VIDCEDDESWFPKATLDGFMKTGPPEPISTAKIAQ